MNAVDWKVEQKCLAGTLSLTDVQKKLFPAKSKLDRSPVLSENKYTPKTLVGNWFEHRAVSVPELNDWRTLYETDFQYHDNKIWKSNQAAKWNNKLTFEGLPQDTLFHHKEEYYNNMTTSYDLCYNVLSKVKPRIRTYNARQRKWIPEQDLLKSFGSLTQFGLRDVLKEEIYRLSDEGVAKCRWSTTYREEISQLQPINIERPTQFNRRKVNLNDPDLSRLKYKPLRVEECLVPLKLKM